MAIGPTGSPILNKKLSKFFINNTIIPAIGPKLKVANNAGISLKSNVKYGGKNGIGNLINSKINEIALNILIVISLLVCCCILNNLLPFTLHRKGGFKCITKTLHLLPSRLYCRLQIRTRSAIYL